MSPFSIFHVSINQYFEHMNLGLKAQSFLKIDLFAKLMILAKGTKKKNKYFD